MSWEGKKTSIFFWFTRNLFCFIFSEQITLKQLILAGSLHWILVRKLNTRWTFHCVYDEIFEALQINKIIGVYERIYTGKRRRRRNRNKKHTPHLSNTVRMHHYMDIAQSDSVLAYAVCDKNTFTHTHDHLRDQRFHTNSAQSLCLITRLTVRTAIQLWAFQWVCVCAWVWVLVSVWMQLQRYSKMYHSILSSIVFHICFYSPLFSFGRYRSVYISVGFPIRLYAMLCCWECFVHHTHSLPLSERFG